MLKELKILIDSGSENRETFFARVEKLFPTLDTRYQDIQRAYDDAKNAFREKWREDGKRYFEHLRGVTLILIVHLRVKDHRLIIAALLHDIVEDCPEWPLQRVRAEYGDEVALLVEWLTKRSENDSISKEECARLYHDRFRFAPREFFLIKLPDRLHNLMNMWACDAEKKKRKIEETRSHYLLWAEEHCILIHELEAALAEVEETLKASASGNENEHF